MEIPGVAVTVPAKQQRDPVLDFFRAKQDNLIAAVPRGLEGAYTREYLMQGIALLLERNPGLRDAHPKTVYASILAALRLGLDPTGATGEVAIIVYKGQATLQLMALGKLHLAERFGGIELQSVGVLHENDVIEEMNDAENSLKYRRAPSGARGRMTHAYCRWYTKSGRVRQVIMDYDDFLTIKEQARVKNGGKESPAYKLYENQMFERSVISRAMKRVDRSPDLLALMASADNVYAREAGAVRRDVVVDESGTVVLEEGFTPAPRQVQEDLRAEDLTPPAQEREPVLVNRTTGEQVTERGPDVIDIDPDSGERIPTQEELDAERRSRMQPPPPEKVSQPMKAGKQSTLKGMP
jgi:recombinational DNA repair protein RecT